MIGWQGNQNLIFGIAAGLRCVLPIDHVCGDVGPSCSDARV